MRSASHVFLLPFAASLLAYSASAQVTSIPVSGPYQHVQLEYNLETGILTRVQDTGLQQTNVQRRGVFQLGALSTQCFENSSIAGNVGIVPPGVEWVDWGTKDCTGTDLLSSIEIGWATRELDPSLGGAGGAMEIALYQGTVGPLGIIGTEVLRLPLMGLPGSADGLSYTPYSATINLVGVGADAPRLESGKIGWGAQRLDATTGPLLANVDQSQFGPDPFGYEADSIADGFEDISGSGTDFTSQLSGLDDGGAIVPIGFNFDFYGTSMSSIAATTNGYLTAGSILDDFTAQCLPSDGMAPTPMIAPAWSDLRLTEHGAMFHETRGAAPCREFIVQWENTGTFADSAASVTMQVKLFETSNAIEFHYGPQTSTINFNTDGSQAMVGVELDGPTGVGLQIACQTAGSVVEGQSYRLTLGRENANGVVDSLSSYIAPASAGMHTGNFFIGNGTGSSANFSSLVMSISEEDGSCATAAFAPAFSSANPSLYTSNATPVLGSNWTGTIDVSSFVSPTTTYLAVAAGMGGCQIGCSTPFGDMLIDPTTILFINEATPVAGLSTHVVALPPILEQCGVTYFTQAAVLDPSAFPQLTFTNAIDMLLGF